MCRKPAACATYVEFKLADATEQLSLVGVGTLQSALPDQLAPDFLLVLHSDSSTAVQCSALPGQLVRVRGGVDLVQPVLQQAALVGATQQSVVQTGVGLIQ